MSKNKKRARSTFDHPTNIFVNPKTKKPYTDVKRAFGTACDLAELRNLEWHDLRATFCTRLAITGYDAFTIKALMGHRDMKTTERYIRDHRVRRYPKARKTIGL